MAMSQKKSTNDEGVGLKRHLGLLAAVNVIISVMIGSGIFVSSTAALKYSGSIGLCLIIWTACGVVSFLGALCFAELGTLVQRSGADYAYLLEGMRKLHKFWGPLPAFICAWVFVLFLRPAEVAVIILTFAEYTVQPFHKLLHLDELCPESQQQIIKLIALIALGLITYINMTSVQLYVKINNIFGFFKVVACLVVICGGIYNLAIGNTENLHEPLKGTITNAGSIALAFYNGLWAYDGWSSVTAITEEIKRPEVNIPRSISIGVPVITFLYVFMNLAYMSVLTPEEMINSKAVGLDFGERVLGSFAFIIPLGVALSTFGCALSVQFGVTRLCYVAGTEGHMSEPLSYVHIKKSTPVPSVVLQGVITALFILSGDIETLIEVASFLIWVFYGLAFVALMIMRKTRPNDHRPYKVPILVPILSILVAIFLVVVPIVTELSVKYLIPIGFILIGVGIYIPFVYYKTRPRFMDNISRIIQKLCEVVPPDTKAE
ncbi:b(0,+)-type amino acid transporter 1-like [Culicoides brevitarsis]|uniref:b(0,+)-type amino acid transporter 1-like n=1 Tax=Culicoides brevitarsis TaxID=469753 RepID=UPI00307BF38D